MPSDIETMAHLAKTALLSAAISAGTSVMCSACNVEEPLTRSEREQREKEKKAIIAARNSPEALAREAADAKQRAELDVRLKELHRRSVELRAHRP